MSLTKIRKSNIESNVQLPHANAAFDTANSSGVYANAAFAVANNAAEGSIDSYARDTANSASSYANGAFAAANNAVDTWVRDAANSASSYANSGYNQANTANNLAQSAFDAANNAVDTWVRDATNSASSYANSAYTQANTPSHVANSASSYANSGFSLANTANQQSITSGDYANSSYAQANTGNTLAQQSFDSANSASSYANSGYSLANTANTLAQSAFDAANNAVDTWVRDAANSGSSYANSAYIHANAAFEAANAGGGGSGTDEFARTTANAAFDTANSVSTLQNNSFTVSVVHDNFVADGNANTFTLSTEPIDKNYTIVTFDGVVQHKSVYNVTSVNLSFDSPPTVNTEIDVTSFGRVPGNFAVSITHDNFTSNGSNTIFTLSTTPQNENYTLVTINGVVQHKEAYSVSGSTLTLSEAPVVNSSIDIITFTSIGSGGSIGTDIFARETANAAFDEANNKLDLTGGTLTGNLVVGGNIVPTSDNVYYLGSETNRWHSLYVGDGSIYIGDIVLSNDANKLVITDPVGNKVSISSNNIVLGDFVLSSSGAITGDVVITGNLNVKGTTAKLEVIGLIVDDNIIDINEATLGAPTLNAGVRVKRGDENSVLLRWNETNDCWEFTNNGSNYSNIASAAAETYANAAYAESNTRATISYVDGAVANLVNSAPTTLDTLNELALALNNDPSFATTVATNIGIIGTYANSAYIQANTPSHVANSASSYANSAYTEANSASILAQAAYNQANTSGVNEGGGITAARSMTMAILFN
jgi:hypothetical protein